MSLALPSCVLFAVAASLLSVVGVARAQAPERSPLVSTVCPSEAPPACLALIAQSVPTASRAARATLYLAAAELRREAGDLAAALRLGTWALAQSDTPGARAFVASLRATTTPAPAMTTPATTTPATTTSTSTVTTSTVTTPATITRASASGAAPALRVSRSRDERRGGPHTTSIGYAHITLEPGGRPLLWLITDNTTEAVDHAGTRLHHSRALAVSLDGDVLSVRGPRDTGTPMGELPPPDCLLPPHSPGAAVIPMCLRDTRLVLVDGALVPSARSNVRQRSRRVQVPASTSSGRERVTR